MPSVHYSSFEARHAGARAETGDPLIDGFLDQTRNVLVGVEAAIERALAEGWSMVLEGVHLVPGARAASRSRARSSSTRCSRSRTRTCTATHFHVRDATTGGVRAMDKYLTRLDDIRTIQDYIVERAERTGVPVIESHEPGAGDRRGDGARALARRAPGAGRVTDLQTEPRASSGFEPGPAQPVHLRELRARDRARRARRRALARPGRPGRGRGGGVLRRALRARDLPISGRIVIGAPEGADQLARRDADRRGRGGGRPRRRPARGSRRHGARRQQRALDDRRRPARLDAVAARHVHAQDGRRPARARARSR